MEPFEVLTSESQRMLAIVEPGNLDAVLAICERWEIVASVVGTVTAAGRLRILDGVDGEVLPDVPRRRSTRTPPLLDRPRAEPPRPRHRSADGADAAPAPARRSHGRPARPDHDILGTSASTTTSCSSTRSAPGRRCQRAPPQAPGHGRRHRPGAGTRPAMATTGGARSTLVGARHSCGRGRGQPRLRGARPPGRWSTA